MSKETQKHKIKESKLKKRRYSTFQFFIAFIACVSITSAYAVLDEDGDGMSDVWQREYSIATNDTLSDPDNDGHNNLKEARAGTNPNDWNDYFKMMDYNVSPTLDTTSLTWRSLEDRLYQIEVTRDLISWESADSVRGIFGSQSSKTLTIPVIPLNDNYESRLPTATNNTQATGSNVNATVEANEPDNPSVSGNHSIWWTWKPVVSGEVTITTDGSDFDTTLAIYTGDKLTNLVLIDSDDDGGEGTRSSITFTADSNVVYSIQVNGYSSRTGNVVLNHPLSAGTFDAPVFGVNKPPRMFYRVKGDPSSDLDIDNDRLVTWEERLLGTDPTKADTDGDGMSDSFEFINHFDPTNGGDGALDTDGDGVSNAEEEALGTDPRNPDSNGNGINDGNEDFDGDTLTNASELNIHNTDPNNPDTDGDQMPDNWEVEYRLDPNDEDGENGQDGDPDGDGVSNFDEYLNGTDPHSTDTDNDGVDDDIEIDQGSDPNNSDDGGEAPEETLKELSFRIGDPSGSHSENWLLCIRGIGDDPDTRRIKVKGKDFGVMSDPTPFKLRVGKSYEITIQHLGTKSGDDPDYDWEATIDGLPSSVASSENSASENEIFIVGNHWLVDNREAVLTQEKHGDESNIVEGKKAYLVPVDLDIYNGQASKKAVPEKEEEVIGAFTVANLNDTDGDGVVDSGDNIVKKGAIGEDEEDLMKLVVNGPNVGRVKVTVVSGNVEFWEKSTKETKIAKQGNAIFIDSVDLPKTLWVEATHHSNAVRDIELKIGFESPDGTLVDDMDKVKATAVWAEKTSTKNKNEDGLWNDADGAVFKNTFQWATGGKFGFILGGPSNRAGNAIGIEFTLKPTGIGNEPNIKFDVTRQKEIKDWFLHNNKWLKIQEPRPMFDPADLANDDGHSDDEDNIPKNDHIYSFDVPGISKNDGKFKEIVYKGNFNEFVRIFFDGSSSSANDSKGSRCSEKIKWHSFLWVEGDGSSYSHKAGKQNTVGEGHLPLGGDEQP